MYESQVEMITDAENSFARAKVVYQDKLEKINAENERLAKEIDGRRPETVIRTIFVGESGGSAEFTDPVTQTETVTAPSIIDFEDFRIKGQVFVAERKVDYSLAQQFRMNLYVLNDTDYRAELVELNRETGDVVDIYEVEDFVVQKQKDSPKWHFGTNLMVGANGAIQLPVPNTEYNAYAVLNFISKGATHLDSSHRLLSLGPSVRGVTVIPYSYRIANHIPLLSDLFIDIGNVTMSWRTDRFSVGVGISSTL